MKVKVEVDATPEEYRRLFGLPDVSALQDELVQQLRQRIESGLTEYDPVKLMEPYITGNIKSFEAMQKLFWNAMAKQSPGTKDED
jgi:hypothetical protein